MESRVANLPGESGTVTVVKRALEGRISHYYSVVELQKLLRDAKRKGTRLDLVALDEMLDCGWGKKLIGLTVDWHGRKGTVEQWAKTGKLSVRIRTRCDKGCGRRITLHMFSGVHTGAFCIVRDRDGKYVADLRDVDTFCGKC